MPFQRPDYEIFDYPGRFKDEQHGAGFTRYQLEGLRNNAECADGSSNSRNCGRECASRCQPIRAKT